MRASHFPEIAMAIAGKPQTVFTQSPLILLALGLLAAISFGELNQFVWAEINLALQQINLIRVLAILLLASLLLDLRLRPVSIFAYRCMLTGTLLTSLLVAFLGSELFILTALTLIMLAVWRLAENRSAAKPLLLLAGALLVNLILAPIFFHFFSEQILKLDAWLVFTFSHWIDPGTVLNGTSVLRTSGFGVILVGACSAFNALSMAMLTYLTWVVFRRGMPTRPDVLWLLLMTLAIVLWNVFRISQIGGSPEGYAFWHGSTEGALWISASFHGLLFILALLGERLCRP